MIHFRKGVVAMHIGSRIKDLRIANGLTQKQLGELCGMADSAIRRYESGRGNPTEKTLRRIANALGVPVGFLDPYSSFGEQLAAIGEIARCSLDEPIYEVGKTARRFTESEEWKVRKDRINAAFDTLNDEGQQKAVERVEELTEIPKYQCQETPQPFPEGTDAPDDAGPSENP